VACRAWLPLGEVSDPLYDVRRDVYVWRRADLGPFRAEAAAPRGREGTTG